MNLEKKNVILKILHYIMKLDELAIQFLPILFCELECRQRIVGGLEGAEDTLDAK